MGKQASPNQNKGDRADDRKNGKAWKKVDGGARQRKTGRTVKGYSIARIEEWAGKRAEHTAVEFHNIWAKPEDLKPKVLSKTKLVACEALVQELV